MSCKDNTTLFVHVGEESKECSKPDLELSFKGLQATVLCPDPAVLCGILQQYTGGGDDGKGGRGLSAGAIAGIVIAVLAIVVVVVVVVIVGFGRFHIHVHDFLLAQLDHFHFPRHLLRHEAADCGCSVIGALIQSEYQQGDQQLNDSE